ncbi:E3 ubiquitin-protein ligase Topors [Cephus cinctus]|uniref:E3 ubiquitin-protein ligase Topors n=1 Tax=Cephus cinctus TaxID=211228 RepID=A0AAJ7BGC7_CEPCN|nr:E3 ubiquitin-protein ligase Topors [Cephus cinctus]
MEGQLERKDASSVPKEPIKLEIVASNPETGEREDGAPSPPPNCSICLGKLVNTSFTDSCLHQFCFNCLLRWSKIKTECPLCKQTFKSIIHNVRSEEDYDQYHVPRELASQIPPPQTPPPPDVNFGVIRANLAAGIRPFVYRTTMTSNRRYGMFLNPEQVARREQIPSVVPPISSSEHRRRRANPTAFRRNIYRQGIWATPFPDIFGRFQQNSADYYRRQPADLLRLMPWINRELQVLLNHSEHHIAYVMQIIMDALSRYDIRSPEFRDIIRPYFNLYTEHFVHELLNYARTNYDVVGYDQYVTYIPNHGLSNSYVRRISSPSSSSSDATSDDSDVRVLDETIEMDRLNYELPSTGPHTVDMPGPSNVRQAFSFEIPTGIPDVLTISSNSSGSSDECEIVGYVKPRHERTPEIIELVSSGAEDHINPSASQETTICENSDVANSCQQSIKSRSPSLLDQDVQPSTSYNRKRHTTKNINNRYSRIGIADTSSTATEDSNMNSDSDYNYQKKTRSKKSNNSSKIMTRSSRSFRSNQTREAKSRKKSRQFLSSESESEDRSRQGAENAKRSQRNVPKKYVFSSRESSFEKNDKRIRSNEKSTAKTCKSSIDRREKYKKKQHSSSNSSSSSSSERSQNSSSTSSESERNTRRNGKSYVQCEERKEYSSWTSDSSYDERISKRSRNKKKLNVRKSQVSDTFTTYTELNKKDQRYLNIATRGRNTSESRCELPKTVESNSRWSPAPNENNSASYDSAEYSDSVTRDVYASVTNEEKRMFSRTRSSSCSDFEQSINARSSSQCSTRSDKTHSNKRKSKHKDKHRDKKNKPPTSKSTNSLDSSSTSMSLPSTSTASSYNVPSLVKHSDSKKRSNSKEKHKSHKKRKESKRRRSRSETKSKSKRKRRRIRSSSSSNSNRN